MAICPRLNCTYLESGPMLLNPPSLEPDPDISGYGVLIGFTGTGFITLVLLIIQYVLGFAPDSEANPIDRGIIRWLWRKSSRRPSSLWGHALEKSILLMSDQQMITGIAILASGYFQLCSENGTSGISSFDWQIVIYLAWFSSLTHLTTLTALRTYMIENPVIRIWRLLLMFIIVVMLITALIPTMQLGWFYNGSGSSGGVYAGCFYRSIGQPSYKVDTDGLLSLIVSLVVLLVGYASKSIKLFPRQSGLFRRVFRTTPGNWWKRRLDRLNHHSNRNRHGGFSVHVGRTRYRVELAILITIKAFLDLYHSVFWEILWLLFGVAWGTLHLVETRLGHDSTSTDDGKKSEWGFGQFISTFLLALPLLSMAEACYETKGKLREGTPVYGESTSHLVSAVDDKTPQVITRPRTAPTSSTLLPSQSSATLIHLPVLNSPTVNEETQNPKGHDESTRTPSPDAELNELSLSYPLHRQNFYQFPWFRHLLISLAIEVVEIGSFILFLFTGPSMDIGDVVMQLALLWIEVFSVIPVCGIYNLICIYGHEHQARRVRAGVSIWKSPGGLAWVFWKVVLLLYIPGLSLYFFFWVPMGF